MNEQSIQSQMVEKEQLISAILDVVYQSEYPLTLEIIADKVKNISPDRLFNIVTDLVITKSLREHLYDGSIYYQKPKPYRGPFPPLPFFHFSI